MDMITPPASDEMDQSGFELTSSPRRRLETQASAAFGRKPLSEFSLQDEVRYLLVLRIRWAYYLSVSISCVVSGGSEWEGAV